MLCLCLATKKQLKFQRCAVGKSPQYTFYCKVVTQALACEAGVYSFTTDKNPHRVRVVHDFFCYSDKIWREGPKGGVLVLKDRYGLCRYITTNEAAMEEFMWAKLSAKSLHD